MVKILLHAEMIPGSIPGHLRAVFAWALYPEKSPNFTVESSYLYPLGSILLTAGVKTSAALKNARVRHGTYDSEKT